MNTYFDQPEISVSDIKSFLKKVRGGNPDPENLEAIFAMGTLTHGIIFEPNSIDKSVITPEITLATKMKVRFFQDELCRMIVMRPDFKREQPLFKEIEVGGMMYKARIKCDGISKGIKTIIEFKGLSITTQKAFEEAIDNLLYDMAAVQYLLVAECEMILIVGISKIKPQLMFKKIIKRYDETYNWGEQKLIDALKLWREYSPEDIRLVA
jgi:hypothetical protein